MYFITVFTKMEEDKLGWPNLGSQRTWGYYNMHEDAVRALHNNSTDMWEYCYDYALIEKIGPGICAYCEYRQWFKYDKEKDSYFEIEEPEWIKKFMNFAIG